MLSSQSSKFGFLSLWWNTVTESNLERRGEFSANNSWVTLPLWQAGVRAGTQGQEPGGRCWSRVLERCCFLVFSPWLAQIDGFLISPGPPVQGGTAHSELGLPTSMMNKENELQICLQTNLIQVFFSSESVSSQVTQAVSSWHKIIRTVSIMDLQGKGIEK